MCFSFLNCCSKQKKSMTSTTAIQPFSMQFDQNSISPDSIKSLKPSFGDYGIPIAKEKFYKEIGGVLILKRMPKEIAKTREVYNDKD